MNKELAYNGHTANPADYECPDGDLSVVMDLWPENGSLRPVLKPQVVLQLSAGQKVMFLHKTSSFGHYIVYDSVYNTLFWLNQGTTVQNPMSNTGLTAGTLTNISGIGNIVIVFTTTGMRYYLWKNQNYQYLGSDIPELELSFGLQGKAWDRESDVYSLADSQTISEMLDGFTDANANIVTNVVMAQVNKHIKERVTDKGKFIFPFFVRYAYRLFDGSLIRHSAPILMCPSNSCMPITTFLIPGGLTSGSSFVVTTYGISCQLDYIVASSASVVSNLGDWKDIVKSIDVFISAPNYTIDISTSTIKKLRPITAGSLGYGLFKLQDPASPYDGSSLTHPNMGAHYMCHDIYQLFNKYADIDYPLSLWNNSYTFDIDTKNIEESLPSVSGFYLLKSIKIEDLATQSRTIIDVKDDYLSSLVNREVMTDDYDSHDKLIPTHSFAYNSRLNIADLKKNLFGGFGTQSLFAYADGFTDINSAADVTRTLYLLIKVQQDGITHILRNAIGTVHKNQFLPALWLYYPNTNGISFQMQYYLSGSINAVYDLNLSNHSFLNGAYFLQLNYTLPSSMATVWSVANGVVNLPNKIYTSDVNNPFIYPVQNINTVGAGNVMAISTAAKALSMGQFGQFPLYAFTTDGVWALEVSNTTGGFSAKQPITRDACLNSDSVTQIDNAVLFVTDRGIMLISGSETKCISDILDNSTDPAFTLSSLPGASDILCGVGVLELALSFVPFRTFRAGCRLLYDYVSYRLIVYNPSYAYAYIYSMKMKQWGMMRSNIVCGVNSYPGCLAMTSDNKLVDFSQRVANVAPANQVLVTRPLKLDAPDILKTINNIIQRGNFAVGKVKVLLYGSRNLANWFPVFSSTTHYLRGFRGTPYKYYRIVLKCTLGDGESINGCSIEFDARQIGQPR